ncbi:hypothetical protein IFM89_035101 [Coptis chinensis]|uniref:Peptidyl-prolyl cis-trans isomerase n=1 Tax=Coptis chinensis TaxID=261450 RepID=A0A835IHE9_9MAGN|nr:hypothetical protein IFM89_035101 [Coptis chinensis]
MSVLIETSLGKIAIDLFTDECPITTKNFLKHCKMKYPTGKGTGGDSIYKFLYGDQSRFFDNEIHQKLKHSKRGAVAMASAGKNLNASQFYITLRDNLDYLDGKHTVFGEVAEDEENILKAINEAYVDDKGRPFKNIRIKHTHINKRSKSHSDGSDKLTIDTENKGKNMAPARKVRNHDYCFHRRHQDDKHGRR